MPCAEWMFFRLLNILRQAGALLSSMWSVWVLAATLIVYGTNTVKGVSKDFWQLRKMSMTASILKVIICLLAYYGVHDAYAVDFLLAKYCLQTSFALPNFYNSSLCVFFSSVTIFEDLSCVRSSWVCLHVVVRPKNTRQKLVKKIPCPRTRTILTTVNCRLLAG